MFLPINIENAKMKLFFVSTIVIISELVNNYLKNTQIFSDSWLYSAFGFLIAYLFYILFIENIKISNIKIMKQTIVDLIRTSTLLLISNIFFNYFEYGVLILSSLWVKKIMLTIIGFLSSDYIFMNKILDMNSYQSLFYNISKIFIIDIIINLILTKTFTLVNFIDNISFFFGYVTWELLVKKFFI